MTLFEFCKFEFCCFFVKFEVEIEDVGVGTFLVPLFRETVFTEFLMLGGGREFILRLCRGNRRQRFKFGSYGSISVTVPIPFVRPSRNNSLDPGFTYSG